MVVVHIVVKILSLVRKLAYQKLDSFPPNSSRANMAVDFEGVGQPVRIITSSLANHSIAVSNAAAIAFENFVGVDIESLAVFEEV